MFVAAFIHVILLFEAEVFNFESCADMHLKAALAPHLQIQ